MNRASRIASVALGVLLWAPLAEAQSRRFHRTVTFGARIASVADNDSVVHVYLDREGSLYPERSHAVDDSRLRKHHDSSLREYYGANAAEWNALRAGLRLVPGPLGEQSWEEVQAALRARLVLRINARADRGRSPILFFVHGFNVDDARGAYRAAMRTVAARSPAVRPVYVQVNWDGHRAPTFLGLPGAWKEGNHNAPLVGLELRRILAALPDGRPVRIITHSLGGSVVASALWERIDLPQAAHPAWARYRRVASEYRTYPLPTNADIRVGMVVPAMGGAAFAPVAPQARPVGNYSLMLVGQNRHDIVVAKGYTSPKLLGTTALAVRLSEYCSFVDPIYRRDDRAAGQVLDFELPNQSDRGHAFELYLARKPMSDFLDLLLARPAPELADTDRCRK